MTPHPLGIKCGSEIAWYKKAYFTVMILPYYGHRIKIYEIETNAMSTHDQLRG